MRATGFPTVTFLRICTALGSLLILTPSLSAQVPAPPEKSTSAPEAVLRIVGLSDMMTGWHRIHALSEDDRVERVRWRVNGRRVASEDAFGAHIYFGKTPQPKTIEAIALGTGEQVQYVVKTTVNRGGRGQMLEFREPVSGARVDGLTRVRVCAASPADDPIAGVHLEYSQAGREASITVPMELAAGTSCERGTLYETSIELASTPASLTARLATERSADALTRAGRVDVAVEMELHDQETGLHASSPALEQSILLNVNPVFDAAVDVRLLEWPVFVFKKNEPVMDLRLENFELHEDRARCRLVKLVEPRQAPLRIGLLFDWSGSTIIDSSAEAEAATEFMVQLFDRRKDSAFVSAIGHGYVPYQGWTADDRQIEKTLATVADGIQLGGGTGLYDSLMRALYEFQSGKTEGIPALVVMTDGLDTASIEFSREDVLAYARESGVRIYPIGVQARLERGVTEIDLSFLESLAEVSGGKLQMLELHGAPIELRREARALRDEAESLRSNPGELENDPRFLRYLIQENEKKATSLDKKAAAQERRSGPQLAKISGVFANIREELAAGYIVIGEARATRADRWHEVQVSLKDLPDARGYEVRTASGVFW